MHVIFTCKYEKKRMKNSRVQVETPFFHNPVCYMETSCWIWRNFRLLQALRYVIITCKYEKIRSRKAEKQWRHHFFHYKPMLFFFPDAQGQLTLPSVVQSGWNLNSSELSYLSSLPASMKRIRWKAAKKKWRHRFLHYNPMGAFCCHGNQSSDPIWPKT